MAAICDFPPEADIQQATPLRTYAGSNALVRSGRFLIIYMLATHELIGRVVIGETPMMTKRRVLRLLGAVGGILAVGACGLLGASSYRFRMTVVLDTPQGRRTGSSVYEVTAGRTGAILPDAAKRDWHVKGEAVAVELPDGKTLFALLKTNAHFGDMMGLSMATLHPDFPGTGYDVVGVAKQLAAGEYPGPVEVAADNYPMLVTFADEKSPASVALVEPGNLTASFGEAVALRRITIELTSDPVTTSIRNWLGWLSAYPEPRLDNDFEPTANPTLAQKLQHGDFIRGLD